MGTTCIAVHKVMLLYTASVVLHGVLLSCLVLCCFVWAVLPLPCPALPCPALDIRNGDVLVQALRMLLMNSRSPSWKSTMTQMRSWLRWWAQAASALSCTPPSMRQHRRARTSIENQLGESLQSKLIVSEDNVGKSLTSGSGAAKGQLDNAEE